MIKKQNILFWDLDNSIVHSMKADSESHADDLIYMYGEYWKSVKFCIRGEGWDSSSEWFVSFLREGALKLLDFSRELLGDDNVKILTLSPFNYAARVNILMGLGFDANSDIFTHEFLLKDKICPEFKDTFNVLIDNENHTHHMQDDDGDKYEHCKVVWLNNLPHEQFIQIPEFTVWSEILKEEWTAKYVAETKQRIIEAFNLNKNENCKYYRGTYS